MRRHSLEGKCSPFDKRQLFRQRDQPSGVYGHVLAVAAEVAVVGDPVSGTEVSHLFTDRLHYA